MQFTNIFTELKKFKLNIQEPRIEKHTFSRTIQEHSRNSKTNGHPATINSEMKYIIAFSTILFIKTNV